VTSDTTIAQLHDIVQIAMGWEDLHLHQFRIHGKTYGIYRDGGISFADDPHQILLADFKLRKSERFIYEYDMAISGSMTSGSNRFCPSIRVRTIRSVPTARAIVHRRTAAVRGDIWT